MTPNYLRAVEPLPSPPWRFDIEKMKSPPAEKAHRSAVRYHGLLLAHQYSDDTEEPEELKTARVWSEYHLLELNNIYHGLRGAYIGIETCSELVVEDFDSRSQLTLVRIYHPAHGCFAGFAAVDVHGLCVITGEVFEERHFPLADIEDITEAGLA